MCVSPDAAGDSAAGEQTLHSGAKRSREDKLLAAGVVFDTQEVKDTLSVSDDYMVLGIDEAGRGPLMGPMVYSGAMITLREHDQLIDVCHVADSKMLDDNHRKVALDKLRSLKTLQLFTIPLSADEISAAMTGRHGANLNTLSHDTAIEIIRQATLAAAGKLCAVYVDTVGPPEFYQAKLAGRFPHLRVTVAKKADSKYPIVSAASIEAKVTRDLAVEAYGEDLGSGYPADPRAVAWLRSHVHRFFVIPRRYAFVRHSWGPVVQLARDRSICVPVCFEQDLTDDEKAARARSVGQRRISFAKPPPRRPTVYTHLLRLSSVSGLGANEGGL